MNKEQLRELVKAHFNLVDMPAKKEIFGEVYDENKAFKIVFPGEELKVGDEVKVVTEEGQESLAPDGYHRLEDGRVIKTEGSSVVEITTPETERKEDEMTEENGLGAVEDKANEEIAKTFAAEESKSTVEGITPQNAATVTDPSVSELEAGPETTVAEEELAKKIKMAVDEAVASAITGIEEEMKSMKAKFEELAKAPATSKTMASTSKTEKFATATNDKQAKMMLEMLKNKNK